MKKRNILMALLLSSGVYTIAVDFDNMSMTLNKQGDIEPEPEPEPKGLTVYWDNSSTNTSTKANAKANTSTNADGSWGTPMVHYWGGKSETTWPGILMDKYDGNIWVATLPVGVTTCVFNDGTMYGSSVGTNQTANFTIADRHAYNMSGDVSTDIPENLYLVGTLKGASWNISSPLSGTKDDTKANVYVWTDVTIVSAGTDETTGADLPGYFTFITKPGSDWDKNVNTGDRYGATSKNFELTPTKSAIPQRYIAGQNASSAESWAITPDTYNIVLDLGRNTVTAYKPVKEGAIKFRDDDETGWLVNGCVPSSSENYDNIYLTIRYDGVDGNTYDAAWDNKHSGTPRYGMNSLQNRSATNPDADNAPITAEQLAAAPVLLKVSVELDNGEGDNTWKVIDTDKYPDWSWNESDHESIPADFYRNQVQDYPTTQGYIRIPLIAKNNTVTVTAMPNADATTPLYGGDAVSATRTYSFAKGSTTSVELPTDNAEQSTPIYYNLQGIRVDNPGRGVYIKVEGSRVSKITIR